MPRPDRRALICDAAIELAAAGSNHAVTHQAIDRYLDLPRGSTSYYFRTRAALVGGSATRVVERSRTVFLARLDSADTPADLLIADYLDELLTDRRSDVLARLALVRDPDISGETRQALANCLFSRDAAAALMRSMSVPDPDAAADDLIVVLEGIVATRTYGLQGMPGAARGELTDPIRRFVATMLAAMRGRSPQTTASAGPASTSGSHGSPGR